MRISICAPMATIAAAPLPHARAKACQLARSRWHALVLLMIVVGGSRG
jgi:hypothetical protein